MGTIEQCGDTMEQSDDKMAQGVGSIEHCGGRNEQCDGTMGSARAQICNVIAKWSTTRAKYSSVRA